MSEVLLDLTAGSIGGGVGMIIGHPLDTVKVRMQRTPAAFASTTDCFAQTLRNEGVTGLFKGLSPPLVSIAAYQAVCFASFSAALKIVTDEPEDKASIKSLFLAGSMSGVATVLVTTPADLIKIRLQLNTAGGGGISDMARCARDIAKEEGARGFYRGIVATSYRDTWSTGLYFIAYHSTKRWLEGLRRHWSEAAGGGGGGGADDDESAGAGRAAVELAAGGVAGVASWGSVAPIDAVKTRLQSEAATAKNATAAERSFVSTFMHIVRTEGWRSLYSGIVPLLSRAFVVNAVTFYAYEESMRQLTRLTTPQ